jgi:hypothetical protein
MWSGKQWSSGSFAFRSGQGSAEQPSQDRNIEIASEGSVGTYLESIAYGTNGYRLEAYTTLRCRASRPVAEVVPHDLKPSLDAQESNVA